MILQEELDLIFKGIISVYSFPNSCSSVGLPFGPFFNNAGHLLQIVILFTGCNRWSYLLRNRYGLRISLPKAESVATFKRSSSSERALLAKLYFKWKAKVVNRTCSSLERVMQDGSNSYILIESHYYYSSLAISV